MKTLNTAKPLSSATVVRAAHVKLPTEYGLFDLYGYQSLTDGKEHLALVKHPASGQPEGAWLTRLHSECLTGDVLGSHRCDCGPQLQAALERIEREGQGVVLYLRQEGRGIGLINKLRAYELQEQGLDTLDANLALGFPADARDYGPAAAILRDLGIERVRLMSNNPLKVEALRGHGLDVEREAHEVPPHPANVRYMATKRVRMGHLLGNRRLTADLLPPRMAHG